MEVMRHLPTPMSSYDSRAPYQPLEARHHFSQIEKDQPRRPYNFSFRYPPSPPMERQSHTSLPPISTLLANMRESQNNQDRPKRKVDQLDNSRIDPRLNAPPTPPSRPQQNFDAPRSAPARQPMSAAPQPPMQTPVYPTPHVSRQGSMSSFAGKPSMHHHRLSSSSTWSSSSARAPSPQSASEASSARSTLYPPPMLHGRSMPEYSPRTPKSPPNSSTPASHMSDYDRHWQATPHYSHHHPQYAPVPHPAYPPHGPPGTQTLHLSPVSAQPPTSHPDRYVCPQCAKAFSRPSSLRIHVHSHTGEKPFECPHAGCGKAFSVRSNMKRHQRGCHVDGASPKDVSDDADIDEA